MVEGNNPVTDPYLLHSWTNTVAVATDATSNNGAALPLTIPTNVCGTTTPQADYGFSDICWNYVGAGEMPDGGSTEALTITVYRYQKEGGDAKYYEVGEEEAVWALTTLSSSAYHT